MDRITLAAAQELSHLGVTANVISPGPIDTGWMSQQTQENCISRTPLGRLGTPQDTAHLVDFVCSPQGQWINVNCSKATVASPGLSLSVPGAQLLCQNQICAILAAADSMAFSAVQETLGVSDSVLSKQVKIRAGGTQRAGRSMFPSAGDTAPSARGVHVPL